MIKQGSNSGSEMFPELLKKKKKDVNFTKGMIPQNTYTWLPL